MRTTISTCSKALKRIKAPLFFFANSIRHFLLLR
uniref:Uncharacterized protein n=1 Tax=Arundo donax TaxID=35708 RepID=A0A0A8ZS23_ARUDO